MIVVENATKNFKDYKALDTISVTFDRGKIHGIVGRNGSGKTVLFKCICGFMPLTSGFISVAGKQIGKDVDIPQSVGIIIETPGFLPNFSGYKNLKLLALIHKSIGDGQIRKTLEAVGLDPASKKHVGKYSLGMRQRLGIAQAIMENPNLLILDEPFNGLDKLGVAQMRELIKDLRDQGKTILLASHNQGDIDELCDTVCEMDSGILTVLRTDKN